jgi:hypothetical protein
MQHNNCNGLTVLHTSWDHMAVKLENTLQTAEEYDIQRYEGASTLYGRHTLSAYIQVSLACLGWLIG